MLSDTRPVWKFELFPATSSIPTSRVVLVPW